MSQKGIRRAAEVFSMIQQAREELIRMGSLQAGSPEGKQDILLGQLLGKANDAVKDEFSQIVISIQRAPSSNRSKPKTGDANKKSKSRS